jgi:hypothetical protein
VKLTVGPCTCGTKPWEGHVITCAKIQRPDLKQAAAPPRPAATNPDPWEQAPPQEPAATPTTGGDLYGDDDLTDDELLGPCTCGQAPICLPTCARAGGQAA